MLDLTVKINFNDVNQHGISILESRIMLLVYSRLLKHLLLTYLFLKKDLLNM
jgi:hypothetical protein